MPSVKLASQSAGCNLRDNTAERIIVLILLFLLLMPGMNGMNACLPGSIDPDGPVFSIKHGFFEDPFHLEITSPVEGAAIFYTVDGSVPGPLKGTPYTGPLLIDSTTVLRAVSVLNGTPLGVISTNTYIFPAKVIRQKNINAGYPSQWGMFASIPGVSVADYEMDPEMISYPSFAGEVKQALTAIPTVSLATDRDLLFSKTYDPVKGGIYIYTGTQENSPERDWERPVSFEYFDAVDSVSLQVDCGLKIQGGQGRLPEKSPKHSFRLVFRTDYGPAKLTFPLFGNHAVGEFNSIILRAGFNKTWIHHSHNERVMAQYIHDIWAKDTQRAMGHNSSNGFFVHLYINGLYWGIYSPSERLDKEYAESYLGGDENDYDVIKDYNEIVDGNIKAWNNLLLTVNAGVESTQAYNRLRGLDQDGIRDPSIDPLVDAESLADYMILNFYAGNVDWDHHNWVAIRNRAKPGKGFKFFCWDEERILESVNTNILGEDNNNCPSHVFQKLRQNSDFRRLFADRVQRFCFGDGALTPSAAEARWMRRAGEIEDAVQAESARWGDYRKDVHQWQSEGPFEVYSKELHWDAQYNNLINNYFPRRTDNFIKQLRAAKLFPAIDAPRFLLNGKPLNGNRIEAGDKLSIVSDGGIIYYTTDGSDPVSWGRTPAVSSGAIRYSGTVSLTRSAYIKARLFQNGEWSATNERFFILPEDISDLRITEINYHPSDMGETDDNMLEFIEIKNTGTAMLYLGGMHLADAIRYNFPVDSYLGPGGFIVIASDSRSFSGRYGFVPFGEYDGHLDNSGERIVLLTSDGDTLFSVLYGTDSAWPAGPDGDGFSLVPREFNPAYPQSEPSEWRASHNTGGSPGADDMMTPGGKAGKIVSLFQNYPNPFAGSTTISYQLHIQANIELSLYSITGQRITILDSGPKAAGFHQRIFDGTGQDGIALPDGIYFYRIVVRSREGSGNVTGKMMLLR